MTDHKFEPFEKVLVRNIDAQNWTGLLYSHKIGDIHMCGDMSWKQCIPYTPETAHLLGTSQPYEPPKPPVEYEWGQKVEVFNHQSKEWRSGVFVLCDEDSDIPCGVVVRWKRHVEWVKPDRIRPLPDDTAANADD